MRTKLIDHVLPEYTRKEEAFNSITHIVGGALASVYLIACLVVSILHNNIAGVLTSLLYGAGTITLFTLSSIYHGLHFGFPKKVLQVLDHCTIYPMIACTYMPIIFCKIMPINALAGWILFAIEISLASIATSVTAMHIKQHKTISLICCFILSWAVLIYPKLIVAALGWTGVSLLFLGSICSTIGIILFALSRKRALLHNIFHIFMLVGSFFYFLSIVLYVL